ncbi:Splicing factor 3B subunit 3 [Balamuthia mandrillaris]
MHIYSLTLQKSTAITHAIFGNFSEARAQEIVVARGSILELLRPNDSGKMQTVLSMEVFGVIRSLLPSRLTGDTRDYIIVGSDSGRIVILQYNPDKNQFDKVHQETFGKTGCRRIVPGQHLAADPKGRACLIGAIEKQKLVYILNRDSAARLTISSPLEAHKSHTITFCVTGVDVGFDNPIFAAIELSYADADQDYTGEAASLAEKHLVFYELDLGLNHVVRKWSEPIDDSANMLIAVPGGGDGPGGVLICCENYIIWKNQGQDEVRVPIPQRYGYVLDKPLLIVSYATHRQKNMFFFLLQSELGDLYKVTLDWAEDTVSRIKIKYFDTVPVSNALCVLKTGFLFVASEFGNHYLYQFGENSLEDTEDDEQSKNTDMEEEVTYFKPHLLTNLLLIDEMESLSPIIDLKVADLAKEDTKQMYALCGRGPNSSLRILRHGLAVTEMAVSPLPGVPNGVWTVKGSVGDEVDKYIVVSFPRRTLVLSIGENVEEVTDSGFLGTTTTLSVALIGEDSFVQVYPTGIRHIRQPVGGSAEKLITEWHPPGKKSIVHSAVNQRQVIVALSGGELLYFELDISSRLSEVSRKDIGRDISCLDVAPIPEGRQRARFLAVGDYDNTVRILSLDPEDCFNSLGIQAVAAQPESLAIVEMHQQGSATGTLYLNIGLNNGVLERTVLDRISGQLTDKRTRFLGARPVRLYKINVGGLPGLLALSSRAWICYSYQTMFQLTPLSYPTLDHASSFHSEQCPEGIVAMSGNTLRIISPERLGEVFNQEAIPLRYTPRQMIIHPQTNYVIIAESEHNAHPALLSGSYKSRLLEAQQAPEQVQQPATPKVKKEKEPDDMQVATEEDGSAEANKKNRAQLLEELEEQRSEQENRELNERVFGAPKPGAGHWASCIRLLDIANKETLDVLELDNNEAAFSLCTCTFHDRSGEMFLVVGTAKDLTLHPRSCSGGFVHVYRLADEGKRLVLVHKTPVEDVPMALCAFQGRLLVGVGKMLRIYDMGKKRLLRKCENKHFPQFIKSIYTQGDRIVVADLAESFHYVKYRKAENQLFIFADDTTPRWVTASAMLDYDTMAGADKFGNLFVLRLPSEVNEELEDIGAIMAGKAALNGAPHKLQHSIHFYSGETVNTMCKASFVAGGSEALLYSSLMGSIKALLPFTSREDIDFFSHLEMHMRTEFPPLCGRDHLSYRSYYFPVKDVVDGDLCEQFSMLSTEKQQAIAAELDRSPAEVLKKLEVIRNSLL